MQNLSLATHKISGPKLLTELHGLSLCLTVLLLQASGFLGTFWAQNMSQPEPPDLINLQGISMMTATSSSVCNVVLRRVGCCHVNVT